MDTKLYKTTVSLLLIPIWHNDPPVIEVSVDDNTQKVSLTETGVFNFETHSLSDIVVSVKFTNKHDNDTVIEKNLDKAVIIDSLTINGISDPKFVWAGEYWPDYPTLWYNQQIKKPPAVLTNHNYLGWNGTWLVRIQVPAFRWMHGVLGLGWTYD